MALTSSTTAGARCEGSFLTEQWPAGCPEARVAVECYIAELTELGKRFLHLVADALRIPRDTLFSFLSDQHRLKLVRYPPVPHSGDRGLVQGVGPHKDSSGWWTFLLQASPDVGGLQVLSDNGSWVDVPVVPGSFVVNIGQVFEVVSNGVCKATTHRVVLRQGSSERFSVPFFQGVRRNLRKDEAVGTLNDHFRGFELTRRTGSGEIDSPFLEGKYNTWGESQLRTKIRSHKAVGRRFYSEVFNRYVGDD